MENSKNIKTLGAMALKYLEGARKGAQESLEKFAEELKSDPAHAMEWSDGAFQAAALLKETNTLVKALGEGNTEEREEEVVRLAIERIEENLLGVSFAGGKGPWEHTSTSAQANVMKSACANAQREVRRTLQSARNTWKRQG